MIRSIVAIDSKRGMATDTGIPWDLPTDRQYFSEQTKSGTVLMGYSTYLEFDTPFHGGTNYIATKKHGNLRPGFVPVKDVEAFLRDARAKQQDIWNIGGAGLLAETLLMTDELYITQVEGDFHCTKFLPEFDKDFVLTSDSGPKTENNITFRFQIWHRRDDK